MLLGAGCSRTFYRLQADRDAYAAVVEKIDDAQVALPEIDIVPTSESRLFDPFHPDCSPLPPDDPTSHNLMHYVDGKRGYPKWHQFGEASAVEADAWRDFLPRDAAGRVVLNLDNTVQIALRNSREYQRELEDLYLSALDVTFERFRFDSQFFAGTGTNFRADGPNRPGGGGNSVSRLSQDSDISVRRLTTTGGEMVVGLANSLVWQFSGPNTDTATTVLDFSLVQPLLRFGGRAVVMERLTAAERDLLANVRQMEQFRQGFFVEVVTGRNGGDGPNRGGNIGVAGLGLIAGTPSGRAGPPDPGGFWGLLTDAQQIRNQESNVVALRDSLAQLEAAFDAGRVPSRLQVDQARQAVLNGQSRLLTTQAAFKTGIDSFKLTLGLPPDLEVVFDDPFLDRFKLIDPRLTRLQREITDVLDLLRDREQVNDAASLAAQIRRISAMRQEVATQWKLAGEDLKQLTQKMPIRFDQLQRLRERPEVRNGTVDTSVYDQQTLIRRTNLIRESLPRVRNVFDKLWEEFQALEASVADLPLEDGRKELRTLAVRLSSLLLELALDQAAARLESITLEEVDVDPVAALAIARDQRLDWMNARARLVDTWRQIEIDANALRSGLNLTFSGDIQNKGDNPVKFRGDTGRLRVGAQFDTPLTRLAERNAYRETQIQYQRARRDFMLFEDRVSQSLRNTLRIIELAQLNMELRRQAVRVSISQVGQTRERLTQPPKPGEAAQLGATTARDLVSALSDLLDSQNEFLNVWVGYEVLRMVLQFELGTLQLDERGQWIDPGAIRHDAPTNSFDLPPPLPEEVLPPGQE